MPFGNLTDHELFQTLQGKKIKFIAVTQSSIKPYQKLVTAMIITAQLIIPLIKLQVSIIMT